MDSNDILKEARSWIGTPFKHQGRQKHVAVDCFGLILGVYNNFNTLKFFYTGYPRYVYNNILDEQLCKFLRPIDLSKIKGGDVISLSYRKDIAQHVAILTSENSIIHAYSKANQVVETSFNDFWKKRICKSYSFITQ